MYKQIKDKNGNVIIEVSDDVICIHLTERRPDLGVRPDDAQCAPYDSPDWEGWGEIKKTPAKKIVDD